MKADVSDAESASAIVRCVLFQNKKLKKNLRGEKMLQYKMIIGIIAGAAVGFVYYKLVGCRAGG
jgi:hypothetical protein